MFPLILKSSPGTERDTMRKTLFQSRAGTLDSVSKSGRWPQVAIKVPICLDLPQQVTRLQSWHVTFMPFGSPQFRWKENCDEPLKTQSASVRCSRDRGRIGGAVRPAGPESQRPAEYRHDRLRRPRRSQLGCRERWEHRRLMRRQSARHRCRCGQVPQGTANLRFPSANLYLLQDFERFIDQASEDQLNELALAYEEIRRREDSSRISRWIDDCAANRNDKSYKAYWFSAKVGQLLRLFEHLAGKGIPKRDTAIQVKRGAIPRWSQKARLEQPAQAPSLLDSSCRALGQDFLGIGRDYFLGTQSDARRFGDSSRHRRTNQN